MFISQPANLQSFYPMARHFAINIDHKRAASQMHQGLCDAADANFDRRTLSEEA